MKLNKEEILLAVAGSLSWIILKYPQILKISNHIMKLNKEEILLAVAGSLSWIILKYPQILKISNIL